MITVAPGATFEAVTDKFAHSATVAVRIRTSAGADFLARTTSGVAEDLHVGTQAVFRVTLTAPTAAGQYSLVWDDGTTIATEELVVSRDAATTFTPSGHEYVTVDELKATMDIEATYADDDIQVAVDAASQIIDKATRRRFYLTAAETREYTGLRHERELLIGDWNAVTSVALDVAANGTFTQTLVEGTDFDLEPYNAPDDGEPFTSLRLRHYRRFPHCRRNVQIVGDYGWAATPPEVKAYTGILAAQLLLRKRQAPFGILMAGIEIGTSARLARFDPDFNRLLGHLLNVRPFA